LCSCLTAIPGLICGIVGLINIKNSNGQLKGSGMAIAGIVLSLLLPLATGVLLYPRVQKMVQDGWQAGVSAVSISTNAVEISTALRAYADANEGKLPETMDQLVAEGLDPAKLGSGQGGTPAIMNEFWKIEKPGAVLKDLPTKEVIASAGPIPIAMQPTTFQILADGSVTTQNVGSPAR